ncbi:hypothetical protein Q1695_002020 [Nippostrongylus brasiliensis]|nr:hypothetical protein Q1695_002020 [Nippostrongylus brasiliensis]
MELVDDGDVEYVHSDGGDEESYELLYNRNYTSRRVLEQFKCKNRQYGNAVCPECKQSFVNAARLERHLAVHQVFGAYLCPLCGKTYKYEYNLFFHWRKTCQYLNELLSVDQRKDMDVQSLRLLVDEVVIKRNETEPVDIGISSKTLFHGSSSCQLEMPIDPQSPLARACSVCGILIHKDHLPQHEALHSSSTESGLHMIDGPSPAGGYFCDLCGVVFRTRDNLYRHWRSSCPEINANLEAGAELYLCDADLKAMVLNLLWRLRRMARKSPLRAVRTNRTCEEETDPLARGGPTNKPDDDSGSVVRGPSTSSADPEGKALVFMDDYINPSDTLVEMDSGLVNVIPADRGKWNIPVDGKPLECPDCFRQFANAGRLERHISGFHSHYGAFKCLLCGHRFKYDYNLLFHYRHSCAYTKLLVGADVRKLLDAASLRKLVSHIKESDPQLRPGSSRLINVKRRASLKAVSRNVRVTETVIPKTRLKRGLNVEGKKCPVCGVMFFGQKSLDKHIGTVHLLNHNFLDKAITRDTSPILGSGSERSVPKPSTILGDELTAPLDRKPPEKTESSFDTAVAAEDSETPPVLEMQTPGEVVPTLTRCVDVNGEEIPDFDADQLTEMDLMLYTGQLTLGDLVITSTYGEDVEYRVAVGTRHGSQIVLERADTSSKSEAKEETKSDTVKKQPKMEVNGAYPQKSKPEKRVQRDRGYSSYQNPHEQMQTKREEGYSGVDDDLQQYDEENENAQVVYENDYVGYEMDGEAGGSGTQRFVRFADETGPQIVQYVNENGEQCEGYVQFVDDENGEQIVELIDGGEIVEFLDDEHMNDGMPMMKPHMQQSAAGRHETISNQMNISDNQSHRDRYTVPSSSSVINCMPEDFMQESILEE